MQRKWLWRAAERQSVGGQLAVVPCPPASSRVGRRVCCGASVHPVQLQSSSWSAAALETAVQRTLCRGNMLWLWQTVLSSDSAKVTQLLGFQPLCLPLTQTQEEEISIDLPGGSAAVSASGCLSQLWPVFRQWHTEISGGDREENICSDTKINRYVTRAVVQCSVGAGGAAAAC